MRNDPLTKLIENHYVRSAKTFSYAYHSDQCFAIRDSVCADGGEVASAGKQVSEDFTAC